MSRWALVVTPLKLGCRQWKKSMRHKRVIVTHYGGPDALQVLAEECPEPRDGEVRVECWPRVFPCPT